MYDSKKNSIFAVKFAKITKKETKTMARPIAETPILYGEDATRFMQRMHNVQKNIGQS